MVLGHCVVQKIMGDIPESHSPLSGHVLGGRGFHGGDRHHEVNSACI